MKVNILDAHDRLEKFTKQSFDIGECCQDLIKQRPFGEYPFYIFAHTRTDDDGVTKRLIWQPRLTRPSAQTNSMLFKADPVSDNVTIIWIIPPQEMWSQYRKGLLTENKLVCESIHAYEFKREELERPDEDDLPDHIIEQIYRDISQQALRDKSLEC